MGPEHLYHYKGTVLRVVDGDTIDVEIDLGLGVLKRERLRLADIDAAELRSWDESERIEGKQAHEFVTAWAAENATILMRTVKANDKYGRFLAYVYPAAGGESLNDAMIANKLAVPYKD